MSFIEISVCDQNGKAILFSGQLSDKYQTVTCPFCQKEQPIHFCSMDDFVLIDEDGHEVRDKDTISNAFSQIHKKMAQNALSHMKANGGCYLCKVSNS